MARYIVVKGKVIQDAVELDPTMINDGTPCPDNLLQAIPQPDKITLQPDLVVKQKDIVIKQDPIPQLDENNEPVLDKKNKPVMITPPDLVQTLPDIITPQEPLVEKVDDILVDPRWTPPKGTKLIQSDYGDPGQNWPLPAPEVDPNADILHQIAVLEQALTDRRLCEAILGTDNGWLQKQTAAIAALRAKLTK